MRESALRYLHTIRSYELQQIISEFPRQGRVLEIGAGTGHQALALQRAGYDVLAIDLATSDYVNNRVFPVVDYDGLTFPVDARSVDVVFSSNVLEHIRNLSQILAETRRVLAPGGVAIHVLPTPTWRLWTTLSHYPWLAKRTLETILLSPARPAHAELQSHVPARRQPSAQLGPYLSMLYPARHGERGTTLTELFYFSRKWWISTFHANRFVVDKILPIRLFYTGSMLFGRLLPISVRVSLAHWLGAACLAYILRPIDQTS